MLARTRLRFAVCLTAVLLAGCGPQVISPKPEPPGNGIELGSVQTHDSLGPGPKLVAGAPGAAKPAGAILRVFNLDSTDDPVDGVIEADGSFSLEVVADEGNELRLQMVNGSERFEPLDVVVGPSDTSPTLALHALGDCLTLKPKAEIDTAVQQSVVVTNGCSAPVTIAQPTLRRPTSGLTVGTGAQLAPNESVSVTVQFQAPAGTLEDIVFIQATAAPSGSSRHHRPASPAVAGPRAGIQPPLGSTSFVEHGGALRLAQPTKRKASP